MSTARTGATPPRRLFGASTRSESRRIAEVLRKETVGGAVLLAATVVAMVWANSPWSAAYDDLRQLRVGPEAWHLHLSLGQWAADGLLSLFFFVAGLELKREFVAGDLRDPRRAALPVAAAVGGMVVPAVLYLLLARGVGTADGWAIPTPTDIAFALAVLAVIGSHLPAELRTFLLTLAVVDDLIAITVIAVFFTHDLDVRTAAAALVPLAGFGLLIRYRSRAWWLLVPLALTCWAIVHASGVHATVAGVLLAFTVPVRHGPAELLEHRLRPLSAGVAAPVFAFFSAGIALGGVSGLGAALSGRLAIAVAVGLVVGKTVGILGATYLVARFTRAELGEHLGWVDVLGLALLGGVGFTVSMLIAELAFAPGSPREAQAKVGVLCGSLAAAAVAALVLGARNRVYRRALGRAPEPFTTA